VRRLSPVTLGMALGLVVGVAAAGVVATTSTSGSRSRAREPSVSAVARLARVFGLHAAVSTDAGGWVVRDGNRLLRVNGSDGHPWFLVTFGGPCQIVPGEPSPRQYLPPVTGPPTDCLGFPAEGFAPSLQSESEAIGAARKALRDAGLGPAHLQATRGAVSWHVEALPVADPARRWTASIGADGHIVDATGFLGTA